MCCVSIDFKKETHTLRDTCLLSFTALHIGSTNNDNNNNNISINNDNNNNNNDINNDNNNNNNNIDDNNNVNIDIGIASREADVFLASAVYP